MKRVALGICGLILATVTGCATEGYVKSQVEPVSSHLNSVDARVKVLETKEPEMSKTDRAMLLDALDTAKKALDAAGRAEAQARDADAAAKKAEQSAADAEQAARKSEKIFKLEQKK